MGKPARIPVGGAALAMFQLIRLAILCLAAFIAGVFFERAGVSDACRQAGGLPQSGLCMMGGTHGG